MKKNDFWVYIGLLIIEGLFGVITYHQLLPPFLCGALLGLGCSAFYWLGNRSNH